MPAVNNPSTFQPMHASMNPHATAYSAANVDNKKGVAPPMKKATAAVAMKGDKPAEKKPKKMTKKELATQAAAFSAISSSSNHSNNLVASSLHHPNSVAMAKGGLPPTAMLHQQRTLSVEQEIESMTERTSLAQVDDVYQL